MDDREKTDPSRVTQSPLFKNQKLAVRLREEVTFEIPPDCC